VNWDSLGQRRGDGREFDPAALARERDRIGEQVQDDLSDPPLVGPNLPQPLIDIHPQGDGPSSRPLENQHQGVVDCLRYIEVGEFQLHPPRFDLGQIEDVVDQR